MAGAKELKKRIHSVKNTRKITKTMEMVSTAKSKRLIDRVNASKPYSSKISEMVVRLAEKGGDVQSPLLRKTESPRKVALLVVTANRGLCGGYNSNILKVAKHRIQEFHSQNIAVELHVIGKKGVAFFRFLKIPIDFNYIDIDDSLTYGHAEKLADYFMGKFSSGELDRVEAISTVYYSSASQKPELINILPIGLSDVKKAESDLDQKAAKSHTGDVIYEPEPSVILHELLPHVVKTTMYRVLLEAVTAEQIYRRIAMKAANDAAKEMAKLLNRTYNRIRQASITQEISEIVAGADAIS